MFDSWSAFILYVYLLCISALYARESKDGRLFPEKGMVKLNTGFDEIFISFKVYHHISQFSVMNNTNFYITKFKLKRCCIIKSVEWKVNFFFITN